MGEPAAPSAAKLREAIDRDRQYKYTPPKTLHEALNMPTSPVVETPSVQEVSGSLRRHPELLYGLLADLKDDPPLIAGPWESHAKGLQPTWNRRTTKGLDVTVRRNAHRVWKHYVGYQPSDSFKTAEEAKTAADAKLRADGWDLLD